MKNFGCLGYVKNHKREKSKFDPKKRHHVFLGYDGNSTAYLLQDIETRKLSRARNVFYEKRVVGFTNEMRDDENDDLLFDVFLDNETEQSNAESVEKIVVDVKVENSTGEKTSSSSESENYVDTTSTIIPYSEL